MSEREFSFGEFIRAARLGFRWASNVGAGCWMRISEEPEAASLTRIELAGAGKLPKSPRGNSEHIVWWEKAEGDPSLLEVCPAQRDLERQQITGYFVLVVDENGRRVR